MKQKSLGVKARKRIVADDDLSVRVVGVVVL